MKINFESSTACNARCTFCPRYEMTRPMGEMSDELFHKIIKEGKEMRVYRYSPFMNGEPFVFPRIWEWLDYMQKERVIVALYSNAEKIDVERLIRYKNIQYLNCSLNATTKETYDKVMRGPDFNKVMANVKELAKKAPFPVRVSFVKVEENIHELEAFKALPFHKVVCGFGNWTNDKKNSLARSGERKFCWPLFNQVFILWDGKMVPCCMDYNAKMVLGDVNKEHIRDIWARNEWMREKHRQNDFNIPVCVGCNYNSVQKA